jgi:hypothetical protein
VSGLYLYCFTPPGTCGGLEIAGVGSNPVTCRSVEGLSVWAEAAVGAPRVSAEAVRMHDAVVKAVWTRTPACLPVRFGQWVREEALGERVSEQRAELERALARVAGAAEHGVRISEARAESESVPGDAPRQESGRAYLEWLQAKTRRQAEHERRGRELAAALTEALGDVARAERVDPLPAAEGAVSVSYLVPRAQEAEFASVMDRFIASRPDLRVLLTGPWPPYSFGP